MTRNQSTARLLGVLCIAVGVTVAWKSRTSAETNSEPAGIVSTAPSTLPVNTASRSGDELIAKAIDTLEQAPSIVAQLKHESHFFGQLFVGDGTYQQMNHPDGVMTRMEITVQMEDRVATLRHVSNGQFLYIQEQQGNEQRVRSVDLRKVRRQTSQPLGNGSPEDRFANQSITPGTSPSMINSIATGGLPRLLAGLKMNFNFRAPDAISFQGVPVWAVAGEWKSSRLQELLPNTNGLVRADGTVALEKLPPYFPDRVFVLLGRKGLFPYRLEYRKDTDVSTSSKTNEPGEPTSSALLTMDLFRVQIGSYPDLNIRDFWYRPGEHQKIEDYTAQFMKTLR